MDSKIPWKTLILAPVIVWVVVSCVGCASFERTWWQAYAPSPQPWSYVAVRDINEICHRVVPKAKQESRIIGCAQPLPTGCTIYLPHNAPRWLIEHEEKHCMGYLHD